MPPFSAMSSLSSRVLIIHWSSSASPLRKSGAVVVRFRPPSPWGYAGSPDAGSGSDGSVGETAWLLRACTRASANFLTSLAGSCARLATWRASRVSRSEHETRAFSSFGRIWVKGRASKDGKTLNKSLIGSGQHLLLCGDGSSQVMSMSGDQIDGVDLIRLSRVAQTDAPSRPVQAWLMLVCVVEVEVLLPPSFHDFLCPGLHQSPDKDNVMSWLTCRVLVGPRPRSSPHSISHARGRVSAFRRLAVHSTRFLTKHTHKHPHTRRSSPHPQETQETSSASKTPFGATTTVHYSTSQTLSIASIATPAHFALQQPSVVSYLSTSSARPPLPASHLS